MRLWANRAEAERLRTHLDFPDPASPSGKTWVWKHPYVDRHLPGHPGFDPAHAHLPVQDRPVAVAPGGPELFPYGFLVRQEADSTIRAHYHRLDQFQVFVGGDGRFGGAPAAGVLVHYANAWSAYGPIRSGAQGIDYFTLRAGWDKGAGWMPESAAQLRAVPGRQPRNLVYPPVEPWRAPDPAAARLTCLGSAADGVAAWVIDLADGQGVPTLAPAAGGGQYWLVLQGELRWTDGALGPLGLLFLSRDEPALAARAVGATQAVVVQFARPAAPDPAVATAAAQPA